MDQRGDLGVLPTPLVMQRGDAEGLIAEGMNNTLLLLPTPVFFFLLQVLREWQMGFLVGLYLLSRICPN